jgi:hypothetical protein
VSVKEALTALIRFRPAQSVPGLDGAFRPAPFQQPIEITMVNDSDKRKPCALDELFASHL